ncbi:MAG: sodium/proline symporter [Candidatus Marinimicrobia bacterium]|nr:sodium/proline symporter [Candidatus Neomarinimicrobiota bacterium]
MNSITIGLVIYLLVVLFVGYKAFSRNKTHSDYLLADRKIGAWALSLSERASGESAWLLIGLPGAVLTAGYFEIWAVVGCLLGIFFAWLFIAIPLRNLAGEYNSLTLPDLFSNYFGDNGNSIRIISSLIITFFFSFYVAAQFSGAGKVLNVTFGITQLQGMFIGAGIILIYTLLGGFFAVVWTDVVQAIIMFATLVILPIVGFIELQNIDPSEIHSLDIGLRSFVGNRVGIYAILGIIGGLSWGLGYTGQPHLLIRYMAINKSSQLKIGRRIAFSWAIPAFFGAFFLGIIGLKLYGAEQFSDPEKLMPFMAMALLPTWFAGILISGAIAAMMSTADSQLLVTTSAISEDLYHKVGKKKASPERMLLISRIATIIIGIIAFIFAYKSSELVFEMVSYAWAGLGASFGPVLLLILYWKKITKAGAISGMLTGAFSTVIWKNIAVLDNFVTVRFASFILAFIVIIVVSTFTFENKDVKQ